MPPPAPPNHIVVMDDLLKLSAPPVLMERHGIVGLEPQRPSARARARPTSAVQLVGGRSFLPPRPGSAMVQVGGQIFPPFNSHGLEPYLPAGQMPKLNPSASAPGLRRKKKKSPHDRSPQEDLERSLAHSNSAGDSNAGQPASLFSC